MLGLEEWLMIMEKESMASSIDTVTKLGADGEMAVQGS